MRNYIYRQLQGYISKNNFIDNLFPEGQYKKIGIQTEAGKASVKINEDNPIIIGITGKLEIKEVDITSFILSAAEDDIFYTIDYYQYI